MGNTLQTMCRKRVASCELSSTIKQFTGTHGEMKVKNRSSTDHVAVDESLRTDVMNAQVVRGRFDESDHYTVIVKLKMRNRWECGKNGSQEKMSTTVPNERLDRKEYREKEENI